NRTFSIMIKFLQSPRILLFLFIVLLTSNESFAQINNNTSSNHGNKFEQLGTMLSDPNIFRTASGAPGSMYWQQKADYVINVEVDEKTQMLKGSETITYTNNSPDPLNYLWIQLDENEHADNAESKRFDESSLNQ